MLSHRRPPLVIDAAIAEHLEILHVVRLGRLRIGEGRRHADAFERRLRDAVDHRRLGKPGDLENGPGHVDHVMELRPDLALALDAVRPVHDRPVARAAPVRRDLLGPLVRRAQRVRPADGVVVVRLGRAEIVDLAQQEFRRLDARHAVQRRHLIEAAVERAFGRRTVVADDEVDERVVEDLEIFERVDQPADMVVGLFQEAGVDLHLPREHRLQFGWHVIPGGNFLVACGQHGILRNDTELLLPRNGFLAQLVPAAIELTLVLVRPFLGDMVRRVRRARREVHEERLVGHQRLLLTNPRDGAIRRDPR